MDWLHWVLLAAAVIAMLRAVGKHSHEDFYSVSRALDTERLHKKELLERESTYHRTHRENLITIQKQPDIDSMREAIIKEIGRHYLA